MENTENEKQCAIHDVSCCFVCGAKIKREGNSFHVWDIEYECGCKIWGAIDAETHGNGIEVDVKCPNSNYGRNYMQLTTAENFPVEPHGCCCGLRTLLSAPKPQLIYSFC